MKRNIVFIFAIPICTALMFGCTSRKPGANTGIVTFKLGSASIQQGGGTSVELQVKDAVLQGDTIVTGPRSTAVIQFSENCVIRIEESSTIQVQAVSADNRELFVREGQVLAKLIRTGSNNARISTPTAVAGVRGTQFSVNYRDGRTRVAVSEGKVAVSAARADVPGAPQQEETITEAGSTAVVVAAPAADEGTGSAAPAVEVRPITEAEKTELKKIEVVPVVPEAENKTAETIETTVQKASGEVAEKEEESPASRQEKVKALMEKKTRSMEEIREVFNRIDEITLYNGRVIRGAVISRGDRYTILTPNGTVSIPEKEIKGSRILK